MFRIDGPGATNDNKFTEGDPANGARATVVTEQWLNAVQEEIANAIEGEGLDLNKQDSAQLKGLFSGRVIRVGSVGEGFANVKAIDGFQYIPYGFYENTPL